MLLSIVLQLSLRYLVFSARCGATGAAQAFCYENRCEGDSAYNDYRLLDLRRGSPLIWGGGPTGYLWGLRVCLQ